MLVEYTCLKITTYLPIRGVYRTQSNIYGGDFLQKKFSQKSSIVDVPLGFKYVSAYA